jgi:hypothetical protein
METDLVSETMCSLVFFRMPGDGQSKKPGDPECYTPYTHESNFCSPLSLYLCMVYITTLSIPQIIASNGKMINTIITYITQQYNNKKFWEELIAYFPFIRHEPHRKRRLQRFFFAAGTSLPSRYLATIGGYTERPRDSPFIREGPYRK